MNIIKLYSFDTMVLIFESLDKSVFNDIIFKTF